MARLEKILEEHDLMGEVLSYHTGGLTKAKIDTAVQAKGYTLPLPNKVSFHLYKMDGNNPLDVFLVTWLPLMNAYGIEKLTIKG